MLPKTIIKSNHLELMNRFMEIAINNVKPVIYKTNYEGWRELWYNIKNNYKIMNFEKYGDIIMGSRAAYYINNQNEVLFFISENDNNYFYIKYKDQKLEYIQSKERLDLKDSEVFWTNCDFSYNLNNELVILTRDDSNRLYYYLVFGKEDIKETNIIKKIDFISEIEECYLERKFYHENHEKECQEIINKLVDFLMKKDFESIKDYFIENISYTDINTYGFYDKGLHSIFKLLLDSKEIIKAKIFPGLSHSNEVMAGFQIKEKDNRVRNVIYSFVFNHNYIINYVEKVEPWLFGFREYEEEK